MESCIIYQVHESYGEWEDHVDRIVGSFFRLEDAEKKKAELDAKEQRSREKSAKCQACPYSGINEYSIRAKAEAKAYCDEFLMDINEYDGEPFCKNYYSKWDESMFYIEKVEVV